MKRVVLALASGVVLLFAFGGGTALACEDFVLGSPGAHAEDIVAFEITGCQANDIWEFWVSYDDGNPQAEVRTLRAEGFAAGSDPIQGEFRMINLGDNARDVTVLLKLLRDGADPPLNDLASAPGSFTYQGAALPVPVDPTPTGTTTPGVSAIPASPPVKSVPAPPTKKKATKKPATKKKSSSDGKSKKKSNSNTDNGSSDTPSVITPTYTAPTITDSPSTSIPSSGSSIDPPSLPEPTATAPPGLDGLAPNDGIPPITPPPGTPLTAAPVAPVAASDEGMSLPIWLVMLLGLTAVLGLGGAQGRLLGFWGGPPRPINGNGNGTQDARLLALQRVALSGASFQKRIAELKKAARDREPVG